jgi:copper resistance protein B
MNIGKRSAVRTTGHGGYQRACSLAVLMSVTGVAGAAGVGPRHQPGWPVPATDMQYGQVLFDRLEYQAGDEDLWLWDAQAFWGGDTERVWLETEGEDIGESGAGGELERLDLFYGRLVDRFWELRGGIGYQTTYGPGPDIDRASLVVGLQGMAPFWFEVDTRLRVDEDGHAALEAETEYDWRLTQDWILQGRAETALAFDEVEEFGIGEGITGLTLGLRLRYHLYPEVAPYVGLTWSDRFGDTADLVDAEGEDTETSAVVAGVRWWF